MTLQGYPSHVMLTDVGETAGGAGQATAMEVGARSGQQDQNVGITSPEGSSRERATGAMSFLGRRWASWG